MQRRFQRQKSGREEQCVQLIKERNVKKLVVVLACFTSLQTTVVIFTY